MAKFMVILHGPPEYLQGMSPEEMQRIFEKYASWAEALRASDRMVVSDKLKDEGGKVLTSQKGRLSVVDGPYSEAKEVVAGYFMIRAASYEEAVEICSTCPHLNFGRIEIRQTDSMGCGRDE